MAPHRQGGSQHLLLTTASLVQTMLKVGALVKRYCLVAARWVALLYSI